MNGHEPWGFSRPVQPLLAIIPDWFQKIQSVVWASSLFPIERNDEVCHSDRHGQHHSPYSQPSVERRERKKANAWELRMQ